MIFYLTLSQIALLALKLLGAVDYSWWFIMSPLIAINLLSFYIAFKREYIKARNINHQLVNLDIKNINLTISTGEKLIKVKKETPFILGMNVCIRHDELNYMLGYVKDFKDGIVNIAIHETFGAGKFKHWNISNIN
jgi:hypothetical protein